MAHICKKNENIFYALNAVLLIPLARLPVAVPSARTIPVLRPRAASPNLVGQT